jgi:hypothetical protein
MYRMPKNAQPSSAGAERFAVADGDFSDQQCGIALRRRREGAELGKPGAENRVAT